MSQLVVHGNPANYNLNPVTRLDATPSALEVDQLGNLKVTQATGLNKTDDAVTASPKSRNLSVISKTTAVTIGGGAAGDTLLDKLIITGVLTGTCVITGFPDSDGSAQSITIPAATTARVIEFGCAINSAGALTITCSNSADDNLVSVIWVAS